MVYNLTVDAKYEDNCEYKSSTAKKLLPLIIEEHDIELNAFLTKSEIKIGNSLEIKIKCTLKDTEIPVKIGHIDVLYENEKINEEPCYLNNQGEAIIEFTPYTVGDFQKITIKYSDSTHLFAPTQTELTFNVKKLGINITITSDKEYISDFETPITINAEVTDENDDPVTYGRITFLHYLHYNTEMTEDRMEKNIGNPVYLDENGKASITYVPMQSYEDDGITNTEDIICESIKAIYNYSNTNKTNGTIKEWDYYNTGHDENLLKIYLRRPNSIGLIFNDNQIYIPDGTQDWVYSVSSESLLAKVNIIDENGNLTKISNSTGLIIHIDGVKTINNQPLSYNNVVNMNYEEDYFYYNLASLSAGYYEIYTTIEDGNTLQDINGKNIKIKDEPLHYYIFIDAKTNTTNLNIQTEEEVYRLDKNVNIKDNVIGQICIDDNVLTSSDNEFNILKNQKCYFYNSTTNETRKGTIIEQENHLIAKLDDDYFIEEVRVHTMNIYTDEITDGNETIPPFGSTNFRISIISEIELSINANTINQYYPGVVQYIAQIKNIEEGIEEDVEAKICNDENLLGTFHFSYTDNTIENIIKDLEVGDYTIAIETLDEKKDEDFYTINKATLNAQLTDAYKNSALTKNIIGAPYQIVSTIISSNGINIAPLELSNFKISTEINGEEVEWDPESLQKINNDTNAILNFALIPIYEEGEWDIKIKYNDNAHFETVENINTISTFLQTLSFTFSEDIDAIQIETNSSRPQYIPLYIKMYNNSNYIDIIGITDTDGILILDAPSNRDEWDTFDKIQISTISSTDSNLIDLLLNNEEIPDKSVYENAYDKELERIAYGAYLIDSTPIEPESYVLYVNTEDIIINSENENTIIVELSIQAEVEGHLSIAIDEQGIEFQGNTLLLKDLPTIQNNTIMTIVYEIDNDEYEKQYNIKVNGNTIHLSEKRDIYENENDEENIDDETINDETTNDEPEDTSFIETKEEKASRIYEGLLNQLKNCNSEYLYTTYKESTATLYRPLKEDD